MTFVVRLTEECVAMLEEFRDRRVRGELLDRIRKLAVDPEEQGKVTPSQWTRIPDAWLETRAGGLAAGGVEYGAR